MQILRKHTRCHRENQKRLKVANNTDHIFWIRYLTDQREQRLKRSLNFIINKTVAESAFSFRVCFWLKSSEAEMRRSRVVAEDDLSQKQTRKLKVDEATVLFMINTSRTKFCVLNVTKSVITNCPRRIWI